MNNAAKKIIAALSSHSEPIMLMKDLRIATKLSPSAFDSAILELTVARTICSHEHDFGGDPQHVKMRGSWFSSCSIPRR